MAMGNLTELRASVAVLCRAFLIVFAAMALMLAYWQVVQAPMLRSSTYNPRAHERAKTANPGSLLAADGEPILQGERTNRGAVLTYADPVAYCHLTGYNSRTGLQKSLHHALYGLGRYENPVTELLGGRPQGCKITLTISARAQKLAAELMHRKSGAVVAVDPRDGAVRVMVSAPGYDPRAVLASADAYRRLAQDPDAPELNRALLGQYAPGSVLKVFTAAAALDAGLASPEEEFHCDGEVGIGGTTIRCRRQSGHGELTFAEAFADSCNVVFGRLGAELGPEGLADYAERFHLLAHPELPLPGKDGKMAAMDGADAEAQAAEAGFGQGATLVSPAQIARMAATIANRGEVPKLRLVQSITRGDGAPLYRMRSETLGRAVSASTAETVTEMMVQTVDTGTGRRARLGGLQVAGKTGSAQNPAGPAHAWFVGFAPADAPEAVVAVVIEHAGSGGEEAAPLARRVLEVLLEGR